MSKNNRKKVLNQLVNELKKKVVIVNEKFRKSELEGIEKQLIINTAQKRIEKLEGCNKALIDNNAEIKARKQQLREELADVNAKLEAVSSEKEALNVECEELLKERFRLASENTNLEKDKTDWMNRALEDISGAGDLREENSILKNKVASIEHRLSQYVETSTYWKGQAMDKNKDLETVREWNDELIQRADYIEKDRKYWLGRYNDSEDSLKEMTKQKQAFEKKSKLLEAELNADKKVIQDYVSEVSVRDKKIDDLKVVIGDKNTEIIFYKDIANKFEDECINLKRELAAEKNKPLWKKVLRWQ